MAEPREAERALRVVIELEPGRTPIRGRIVPEVGEPEAFAGYVELIASIEGMRRARDARAGSED